MTRLYGYAPGGGRLVEAVPHKGWETTTFLCALRADGPVAPLVIDGAVNGELFLAWVRQHLAPRLRPGDVVVCDNLSVHRRKGVAEALEDVGARIEYLPPYSPDFNPIERMFSKLKALLRAAAERLQAGLEDRLGRLTDAFTPAECRNYLRGCGYNRYSQ